VTVGDETHFMSPVVLHIEYKMNAYPLVAGGRSSLALVSNVFEGVVIIDLLELESYSILP
jgi:hypothetical protein